MMSGNDLNRRDFLRLMGWSAAGAGLAACDLPSTTTLEEGEEVVVSYLSPKEYMIPGVGVWYASTCRQCASVCGIHGKVREGHPIKLEGNPDSPLSRGKLCQMGQAGIQGHYNPDRMQKPMLRKDGKLVAVGWDEATRLLEAKIGSGSGLSGERFAWVTGEVSGHQAVLMSSLLEVLGSANHFVHETIAPSVARAVNQDMLGEATPRLLIDKAKLILSFGADILGSWIAPLHFSTEYAKFRATPRGILIQIEPKMTLTGANADLWLAARPGTEGLLALGIAHVLQGQGAQIPEAAAAAIAAHDPARVAKITGITPERIEQIATLLKEHSPSLVLAGAPVEGQVQGYQAVAAVMLLNVILGNIGQTIVPGAAAFPFQQLVAKPGGRRDLLAFNEAAKNNTLDAVFFYNTNPLYSAPAYLKLHENLQNIPFKVAFSQFPDETAMAADLVIPILSYLEDWGTHVAAYQAEQSVIHIQQPLMERIYPDTVGLGDMLLTLLKMRKPDDYKEWGNYYVYLQEAVKALPAEFKGDAVSDAAFWNQILQKGVMPIEIPTQPLKFTAVDMGLSDYQQNTDYPLHLVPYAQLGLWDGRHANLPWLQEAPDQISKVVWDSWAELHPTTAAKLGIVQGDVLEVASDQGKLLVKAYLFKGIHPDAIAIPMGQGHEAYGRYAEGRGVNPLKILSPVTDAKTGELALYGTRVKVTPTGRNEKLVVEGRNNISQQGRKLVATISADLLRRTEGA